MQLRLVGVVVEIDAAHGVLHHVLHNPVGREDLCGGRNLVGFELALFGKHLVLALGDIELVEPADEFGRTKILFGDKLRMVKQINKSSLGEDIGGKEQLGIVADAPETLIDDGILMAVGHNEQGKLLIGLAVIIKEFGELAHAVGIHLRHTTLTCFADQERNEHILTLILQYRRSETILHQNADGHQAVEPSIGSLFCHFCHASFGDSMMQGLPLVVEILRHGVAHKGGTTTLLLRFLCDTAVGQKAQCRESVNNALHQYISSFGGEAFQSVRIHFIGLFQITEQVSLFLLYNNLFFYPTEMGKGGRVRPERATRA